jgi:hypothetical protein
MLVSFAVLLLSPFAVFAVAVVHDCALQERLERELGEL